MCKKDVVFTMFRDKTLLITGGTDCFGRAVLNWLIDDFKENRIFSRDEKKQDDMRENSRWDRSDDLIL